MTARKSISLDTFLSAVGALALPNPTIHQHDRKSLDAKIVREARNRIVKARHKYPLDYLDFILDPGQFEYAEP
ncbi:hypothetical protein [Dokdonella sp.]|uniref:hypothetical protein n=1 Tax=Dokdonella sp. TaxID=2291710 RepID=UPI0025C5C37A|nr:hypothetical protein [Dokdonella sp.]MBX3688252.1 hypothetical protein [Dokdonella sp.]